MKIGLFFGSFNPVHIGQLAIANYMVEYSEMDEIWMIISPQNPLKNKKSLLNEYERLKMVELSLDDHPKIIANNIEFRLPKPSYTIDTLTYLSETFPKKEFGVIMGADNLSSFEKWKNYEEILKNYKLYVYPRAGSDLGKYDKHKMVIQVNAPQMEISSSFIRQAIKDKKDIRYFLPIPVFNYITTKQFYEN